MTIHIVDIDEVQPSDVGDPPIHRHEASRFRNVHAVASMQGDDPQDSGSSTSQRSHQARALRDHKPTKFVCPVNSMTCAARGWSVLALSSFLASLLINHLGTATLLAVRIWRPSSSPGGCGVARSLTNCPYCCQWSCFAALYYFLFRYSN